MLVYFDKFPPSQEYLSRQKINIDTKEQKFLDACDICDLNAAKQLVSEGCKASCFGGLGLIRAVNWHKSPSLEFVKYLIEDQKVSIRSQNNTVIKQCIYGGKEETIFNYDTLDYLISMGGTFLSPKTKKLQSWTEYIDKHMLDYLTQKRKENLEQV